MAQFGYFEGKRCLGLAARTDQIHLKPNAAAENSQRCCSKSTEQHKKNTPTQPTPNRKISFRRRMIDLREHNTCIRIVDARTLTRVNEDKQLYRGSLFIGGRVRGRIRKEKLARDVVQVGHKYIEPWTKK